MPHPKMPTYHTERRQEALGLLRGLEAPHGAFPLACGLVGVLGAIVEILVLAMVDLQLELFYGGAVALELVGYDDPGDA
jgi:hypothetical protein